MLGHVPQLGKALQSRITAHRRMARKAIESHLSFQQTLYSWNQIAQGLAEKSRNRLLQLAKWRAS
jgi:hypothetical protein